MVKHTMWVRIDGEPFLSRALAYREAQSSTHEAWSAFAMERGSSGIPVIGGSRPSGLNFDRDGPQGWTKPNGRAGYSRPKRGHPDIELMQALPKWPDPREVFGDAIQETLSYEGPNNRGFGHIGRFWGPWIGWAGDTFVARIPDAAQAVADHLSDYPDDTITNGADKWTLPPGLTRISEAEKDLIFAQYEVEQERKPAA